jgi:hypothetical protein
MQPISCWLQKHLSADDQGLAVSLEGLNFIHPLYVLDEREITSHDELILWLQQCVLKAIKASLEVRNFISHGSL